MLEQGEATMKINTTMMLATTAAAMMLATTSFAQQPKPTIEPMGSQPNIQTQRPKVQMVKRPDLKTQVAWVGGSGAGRTVNLKIYNIGEGNSTQPCSLNVEFSYYACCYGQGGYQEPQSYVSQDLTFTIPALAKGASHQYQIPIPSGVDYRPFSARVYVDSGDQVMETNEENNIYTLSSPIQPH
ncbi:MAG: hypothetical protein IPM61_05565 [Chlorobi bacterium]|nr:hypothetical protein [Chlorobiota bacterium]MBX7216048.1 hypothetical protein [Candidatus Kapabacteria bacterium]